MSDKISQNHIKDFKAVKLDKSLAKKQVNIAKALFDYADKHVAAVGDLEFNNLLKQINKDNIVSVIKQYDVISENESIIEMILDEYGSTDKEMSDALIGKGNGENQIRGIFTLLLDRANSAGVDKETIETYKTEIETELGNQLNGVSSLFGVSSKKLDTVMYALIQTIENQENVTPETLASIASTPATTLQINTNNVIIYRFNKAVKDFKNQLLKDGWTADVADGVSRVWNNPVGEYLGISTGNTAEAVREDLRHCRKQIDELIEARKQGDQAYRDTYQKIFGVAYNATNIKAYQDAEAVYVGAIQAKTQENSFKSMFKLLLNDEPLAEEGHFITTSVSAGTSSYIVTATKEQVFQREFENVAGILGEEGKEFLEGKFLEAGAKTIEDKYIVLQLLVGAVKKSLEETTNAATGGRSIESVEKQYNNSYKAAFGLENDIMKRVNDYNVSQQKGSGAVKSIAVVGVMAAVSFITAGAGLPALGPLATAGVITGATATVEVSDRFTSGAALKAGREDGFLAYIKKANEMTDWNQVVKASIVSGGITLVFGGQSYLIKNVCAAAGVSEIGTVAAQTTGNIATGLASEYLMTGEISVKGATFTVLFNLVGAAIQIKAIKAKEAATVAAQSEGKVEVEVEPNKPAAAEPTSAVSQEAEPKVLGKIKTRDGKEVTIQGSERVQLVDEKGHVIDLGTPEDVLSTLYESAGSVDTNLSLYQEMKLRVANQIKKTAFGRKVMQGIENAKEAVKTKSKPIQSDDGTFYDQYKVYKDQPLNAVDKSVELCQTPEFKDLAKKWATHTAKTGQNDMAVNTVLDILGMDEPDVIQYMRATRNIPATVTDVEVMNMVKTELLQEMIESSGIGPTKFAQIISNTTEVMEKIGEKSPALRQAIENTRDKCHPTRTIEEAQAFVDAAFPEDASVILFWDEQNPIISPNAGHKFTIIKRMGTASMGETYLAERYDGTQCVVKMLKKGVDAEQLKLEEELYTMLIQKFNPDAEAAAAQVATIQQCYKDWAAELSFASEFEANSRLAEGAKRFSVARTTDLSADNQCLVMDLAKGVQMSKVMEMLKFYKENPAAYSAKYADIIAKNSWLADPEKVIATLPEVITKTFDEQFMFIKEGGKSLMHGDPHMGNYFITVDKNGNLMPEFIDTGLCIERSGEMITRDIKFFSDYLVGNSRGVAEYFVDQCDLTGVDRAKVVELITKDIQKEIFNTKNNVTNILNTQTSINSILDRYNLALSPENATAMKAEMQFFTGIRDVSKLNGGSLDLGPIFRDVPPALSSMLENGVNPVHPVKEAMLFALDNPEQTLSTAYQFKVVGK